jgi:hypothetical protein
VVAALADGGKQALVFKGAGGARCKLSSAQQGIDQLIALVKARLKPMQYRPGLMDGFLAKTGLDLTLP